MNTKEKGDVAVGFAISYYLSHGCEVCLPIGDKRPYDFIVERSGDLMRVQVKYAGFYKPENRCVAALRVMGGNQSFYSAKRYAQDAFDLLFVHTARAENYEIPWCEIGNKSTLTIECKWYKKYRVVCECAGDGEANRSTL